MGTPDAVVRNSADTQQVRARVEKANPGKTLDASWTVVDVPGKDQTTK